MRALREADARRARVANMRASFTQNQIAQTRGLLERNPNLSADLLQTLVQNQVPDPQADTLAQQDDGGFLGAIGDVAGDVIGSVTDGAEWAMSKAYEYGIKPAVRGTVLVADTLAQEVVQRPLTALGAAVQGESDSFRQAYNEYGDSAGLNILQGDLNNQAEGGTLGTGFFLGGQAAAEADAERTLTIRGRRADVGQAFANSLVGQFAAPGDRAYDVVAGVSGFAVDVLGDPLAWATAGASKGIKAARMLDAATAVRALDDVGVALTPKASRLMSLADEVEGAASFRLPTDIADEVLTKKNWVNPHRKDRILAELGDGIERPIEVWVDHTRPLATLDDGHHRLAAAVEAGLDDIPVVLDDASRADLSSVLRARATQEQATSGAGAISGARRNSVLVERARNFFGNERMLQRLADSDAYTIMQTWAQSPANRIDIDTIRRLGDATDQASVADVLFDAVAHGEVTRKGFYSGTGNFIKRNLVDSTSRFAGPFRYFTAEGKLAGLAPRGMVSADDLGDAAGKVDSLLRQTNVSREVRADIFNRIARVEPGRQDQLYPVIRDAYAAIGDEVGEAPAVKELFESFNSQLNELRQYGIDSWGDPVNVPYAKSKIIQNFDGEQVEMLVPTPQITSELASMSWSLPDVTDLRRAATQNSLMRSVYESKGWDFAASTARSITRNVFKPLAILRPAYIVRIGAEEQARLAVEGFDSIWNHPARFISANIRNRDELTDLLGNDLIDVARVQDVITKDAHGILADAAASRGRMFTVVSRADGEDLTPQFVKGWQSELGQLSAAPEARQMANLRGNLDEFRTWAQGEGREHIERLAKVNDDAASLLDYGPDFDRWADGLRRRIEAKTGGWDEDLVGRIVDKDIPLPHPGKGKADDAAFANVLRGKARDGRAPARVKAELVDESKVRRMDGLVDSLFDHITGKPTSYLARYPAFRQAMLRRTGDLFDSLATQELREQAFAAAAKNLGADAGRVLRDTPQLRRLRQAFDSASSRNVSGPIESLDDLNRIVVQRSAEDVKDLLFDVTRRGAAQDALEVVVPFLDAWKEVSRTWLRMMKENPAFFIRAQAGYRELQDQGVFHVNEYGDEVFKMPGGQFLSAFVNRAMDDDVSFTEGLTGAGVGAAAGGALASRFGPLGTRAGAALGAAAGGAVGGMFGGSTQALAGAAADTVTGNTPEFNTELEGRVQGLNLIAQGIGPGFGPVVQLGAGVMPKSPDLDGLRDFLAPFGTGLSEPDDIADPGVLAETFMPAWFRKLYNATSSGDLDERQWNSTVGDAMKALVASGEVDPDDPDLIDKAERYGRWLLVARSFGQFAGPTGPQAEVQTTLANRNVDHPDWNPEVDPTGHWFSVGVLASDYYRLLQTYGPEEAASRFYDMYGAEPFFLAQSKTKSLREMPVDTEGDKWMRRNEGVVEDYPVVAGFFAPPGEDAELDFGVYAQQIERGDRQSLTPAQQAAMAQQVRARAIYQAVKDRTEGLPSGHRERALQLTKARLDEVHPGWQAPVVGVGQGQRVEDKIRELQRAAEDDRLADEPLARPLQAYFALREQALAEASRMGLKTLSSDRVAHLRSTLDRAGQAISQHYPSFAGVWSGVLSREVE